MGTGADVGGREPRVGPSEPPPIAVIDVGSNSGRMVVFRLRDAGHLDILEDARAPLRLARALRGSTTLGEEAIERTVDALRDFRAVAMGAGAGVTIAVATAAVRDADDGRALIERIRDEVGIELEVIDGEHEARYGFLGAVHDLPVEHGLAMDVGGGSMDLAAFRDRALQATWTLPLGSLRLSDRFLASDPPPAKEMRRLRREVTGVVKEAGVPPLADDERLVGIGGTIRNLAKIDRRRVDYPLPLLHGYVLPAERVEEIAETLAARTQKRRRSTPGLNPDRADSIVGGALAVHALMTAVGADDLLVSSRGLREGLALEGLVGDEPPSPATVREASVVTLASRFRTWDRDSAARRAALARALLEGIDPEASPTIAEMLAHAATLVDVGRAIDYYDRFEHAAMIVTAADLGGFSHHQIGLFTAILRQADDDTRLGPYRALLAEEDRVPVLRAATVLALADDLNRRIPPGDPALIGCEGRGAAFRVIAPTPTGWRPRQAVERFRDVFGRELHVGSPREMADPATARR